MRETCLGGRGRRLCSVRLARLGSGWWQQRKPPICDLGWPSDRIRRVDSVPAGEPAVALALADSGHGFALSRRNPPELCFVAHPLEPRERREDRVLTSHPRSAARKCSAKRPHSSIQVVPITRPSLRDGRTAYAVLSREPSSFWPPSPRRKSPAPRRLARLPHSQELDRSNDGQDHTVLPYARPAISPQFSRPCRRSRKLAGETKPGSAVRPRDAQGSRRAIRPAPAFRARRCRVHRKPGSRT